MKKIHCIFLPAFFILSLSFPVHSEAKELTCLTSGYTEDGIYYEIFDEALIQQSAFSRYVMRSLVYQGKVTPQPQIPWEETINGVEYTGTLFLIESRYNVATNKTTTTYEGTLYIKE